MPTVQQVDNCIFSNWYRDFSKKSIQSIVIPLNDEFISYLKEDRIILSNDQPSKFPELQERINSVIDSFGKVFPKLNWSSPKDAAWMSCDNTLACTSFDDIILLLKSSDFITRDLTCPYEYCNPPLQGPCQKYELVLRKFYDLSPSTQFRLFIRESNLMAISQRDICNFYPFLQNNQQLVDSIMLFYKGCQGIFRDSDFVMDIYMNPKNKKMFVLDINPFGIMTDPLLFTWDEILQLPIDSCEFRCLNSPSEEQRQPSYTHNRLPKDMFDFSSNGQTVEQLMETFQNAIQENNESDNV